MQRDTDVPAATPGGLTFTRTYRSDVEGWGSNAHVTGSSIGPGTTIDRCVPGTYVRGDGERLSTCFLLSQLWEPSFHYRGPGNLPVRFWGAGSSLVAPGFVNERVLPRPATGGADVFTSAGAVEQFDSRGVLAARRFATGFVQSASYSDISTPLAIAPRAGLLIGLSDQFGRSLRFRYDSSGNLNKIIGIADEEYLYTIDNAGNVTQVQFPDGSSRTFLFNEPAFTANVNRERALTGVVDEGGVRSSTFTYDVNGLAVATEGAGGANRFTFAGSTVTTPLGEQLSYAWSSNGGTTRMLRADSVSRSCSGCTSSTASFTYDAAGNPLSSTGFAGSKSCHAPDARNLEVVRLEGIDRSAACPTDLVGYTIPPPPTGSDQRKVSTQYHPDWRLPTRIAEPGRITTYVYNGQPDPTAGNAITTCAPASAVVVDAIPIAVLCKQVERATTDTTGSLGFAAVIQSSVPPRVRQWTYNEHGQVLTERDALNNTTTYAYHTTTAFSGTGLAAIGTTVGDLASVTNPLGRVTQYTKYTKHGQLLESIDPNGVITAHTYDSRLRLRSTSVGGQRTDYDYWPTGLLKRVTAPDASFVAYEYDDAHRLRAVADQRGNRIEYTLDNAGNRTAESVKDPGGTLRRQLARVMDAIGRVQQVTGREVSP